jgi:hypothetical protein
MRKQREMPVAGVVAIVVGSTVLAVLAIYVACLFQQVSSGERLNAVAVIFGGIIGASGAALAVYLALRLQRADEGDRIKASLHMEVSEFARLAKAQLTLCERAIDGSLKIPVRDLPALFAMPEPTVYRATVDRLSRLPNGRLFVVFHGRIAEAASLAKIYAQSAQSTLPPGFIPTPMFDAQKAEILGKGWLDVCTLARSILRATPDAAALADASIEATLRELDSAIERAAPQFSDPESSST